MSIQPKDLACSVRREVGGGFWVTCPRANTIAKESKPARQFPQGISFSLDQHKPYQYVGIGTLLGQKHILPFVLTRNPCLLFLRYKQLDTTHQGQDTMLRRKPTAIAVTSEDLAAFEEARLRKLAQENSNGNNNNNNSNQSRDEGSAKTHFDPSDELKPLPGDKARIVRSREERIGIRRRNWSGMCVWFISISYWSFLVMPSLWVRWFMTCGLSLWSRLMEGGSFFPEARKRRGIVHICILCC